LECLPVFIPVLVGPQDAQVEHGLDVGFYPPRSGDLEALLYDVTMPKLSDSMEEGKIVEWKVAVGDEVHQGDVLAEVESDKAVTELECFRDGVVAEIDTDDFNPVFWDPVSNLGLQVQIAFDAEPRHVLVRRMQYQVPPGAEGTDPAQQPTLLSEHPFEVDPDAGDTILITAGLVATGRVAAGPDDGPEDGPEDGLVDGFWDAQLSAHDQISS